MSGSRCRITDFIRHLATGVLWCGLLPWTAAGADLAVRLEQDRAAGVLSAKDYVMQRLYAAYEPERLSAPYRTLEVRPQRCGTILLLEARDAQQQMTGEEREWLLAKVVVRRSLPFNFTTADFKIHYTKSGSDSVNVTDADASGTPDFVEQVAVAFDTCYSEFKRIGYRPVMSDGIAGGDSKIDIYLYRVNNFYGQFFPPSDVYMQMDPRFDASFFSTKGLDAARVTIAHELHHAMQFSHTTIGQAFGTPGESGNYAFFEMTSTFMEDYMFDSVNDYLQYLPSVLPFQTVPFTAYQYFSSYAEYGNSLWNHMLQERFGSLPLLRVWERMAVNAAFVPALDSVMAAQGTSFSNVLNDYHRWNFFTGSRADHEYSYDEGGIFDTQPAFSDTLLFNTQFLRSDTTIVFSKTMLTPKYILIDVQVPDSVRLEMTASQGNALWRYSVVRMLNNKPVETIMGSAVDNNLTVIEYLDNTNENAVLVVSNVARTTGNYTINLKAIRKHADSTTAIADIIDASPNTFTLLPNYPNPFNPETTLRFTLPRAVHIRLTVFDALGRRVKLLEDAPYAAGAHALLWDGRNAAGRDVAGGVYFYRLEAGAFTQTRKMLLLR